jgi:hypothetical protein
VRGSAKRGMFTRCCTFYNKAHDPGYSYVKKPGWLAGGSMPGGACILMGDTSHVKSPTILNVGMGGMLAYISPGASACICYDWCL